jgi:hypothetical protein
VEKAQTVTVTSIDADGVADGKINCVIAVFNKRTGTCDNTYSPSEVVTLRFQRSQPWFIVVWKSDGPNDCSEEGWPRFTSEQTRDCSVSMSSDRTVTITSYEPP